MFNKLKQLSWSSFLVSSLIYIVSIYMLFVTISVSITGYLFFNLDSYKQKIIQTVYTNTGFKLAIGSIRTALNNYYLPELIIENIQLNNPQKPNQSSAIKKVNLVLDYSSLWEFQPIFNKIQIDGSELKFDYESNGSLYLNGIQITDPIDQTLENTKTLPFDVEAWLLRQGNINLQNIGIEFNDHANNLPPLKLHNIQLNLENHMWSKHNLFLTFYGKTKSNSLVFNLNWHGGKIETWHKWKEADLSVKAYSGNDKSLLGDVKNLLPNSLGKESNDVYTTVDAKIKGGMIDKLYANFDVNNFKLALADLDVVSVPKFGGLININRSGDNYVIEAKHLQASSPSGILFDNAEINGRYTIGKLGNITLSNTNLLAINNFLSIFSATSKLNLQGMIQNMSYVWTGHMISPDKYKIAAGFTDVTLKSQDPDIPSLSNVSGDISLNQNSGHVNLALKNSILNYDSIFLIPYVFNSLDSSLDWSIDKNKVVRVTLGNTVIDTPDFHGLAQGKFIYDPNNPESPSYLDMTAHVDRVLTSKVGDYLPRQIPMTVHEWLNMALVAGHGESADMILRGPLNNFPFGDNSGLFYITANINNATLHFQKEWPSINNIYGQFILKNNSIIVKADSGKVGDDVLDKALAEIPNYSDPNGVILTVDGKAHGPTTGFMDYLKNSPINNIIGKLPERIEASGNGDLDLHLKIPFKDPKHTEVKGTYQFINNDLLFDLSIPQLTMVNGKLGFTEHGVSSDGIDITAFNSQLTLTANSSEKNGMHFAVEAPQLDYSAVSAYYLPIFNALITGRADSKIDFTIGKHGIENLTAKSNLVGVNIFAPAPFALMNNESRELNVTIHPNSNNGMFLNWAYGDNAHGKMSINYNSINTYGQAAIGDADYGTNLYPNTVTNVNVSLPNINIESWLATINKAIVGAKTIRESGIINVHNEEISKTHHSTLPVEIHIASPSINFGRESFGEGTAVVFVESSQANFKINTPIVVGDGDLAFASNKMNLVLDKYMLYKKESATKHFESTVRVNFKNGSDVTMNMKLPNISARINNLYYQNHNLGQITADLHQDGNLLYLQNGQLLSPDMNANFYGTSYCFGCNWRDAYVNFVADITTTNMGHVIESLDLGHIMDNGKGSAKLKLQWNGGFQDFNPLQSIGTFDGNFTYGKLISVNTGILGSLFSVINLQGIFEVGTGELKDVMKKGFFYNSMDINASILTSQVIVKNLNINGPVGNISGVGLLDFSNNTINSELAVTPHVGIAVALVAGVATLNPIVGAAVYGAELLSGGAQNKLLTVRFHLDGDLKNPHIERIKATDNVLKNVNATLGTN